MSESSPPPLGPNSLSVVMPAFNEEASIRAVITEHANYVRDLGFEAWEIVCVDDASTDATTQILADLQPVIPQLVVERHDVNRGIYRSFRDDFLRSGGEFIYETGSDGQWPVENLVPMVEQLRAGADLVVGVRNNRHQLYTPARRLISFGFNAFSEALFGVPVKDAGAVKLGRRETFCVPLVAQNGASAAERVVRAQRNDWNVAFVPIRFLPRRGGKATGARFSNVFQSVMELGRCFFHYRLGMGRPK